MARHGADEHPSVIAAAATGIVACIERFGGDVDQIFGHSGIAPDMAGSPTLKLSLNGFCRLFDQSARLTRNDNFGLWFGNQFEPRDLGLWGYAAISAATLGQALETLVELFPLHQQSSTMTLTRGRDGLMRLAYRIDAAEIVDRRQDAELSLGMFVNVMRECLGTNWAPTEVHFEHPKPEAWHEHRRAFSAPVYFSQPSNAVLFPAEILGFAMPARDARLMAAMRQCLTQLTTQPNLQAKVTDRVRSVVRARIAEGIPPLAGIAADLRLPTAMLIRELRQEGLSYSELVEQTRKELAMMYIGQRQLPLSEIAFLVGYSELSAFSRAVRRWTGSSPRQLRQGVLT